MEHQLLLQKRPIPATSSATSPSSATLSRLDWPVDDWYHHHYHYQRDQQLGHVPISLNSTAIGRDSIHVEEPMWPTMMQSLEEGDYMSGPFPERLGEQDCPYYMRTGNCGFGMRCRFNHPSNRKLAVALARDKGEYPERPGQPDCQYYMKTGNCKFGLSCKFHHSKERAECRVAMNSLGFPIRPGEKDCSYYTRTGTCKFGSTCKFNHPQSLAYRGLVGMTTSPMYSTNSSVPGQSPRHFATGISTWSGSQASFTPGSRFQSPSSFAPLIVPSQSLVSVPAWNTYQVQMGPMASLDTRHVQMGPVVSLDTRQQTLGTNFVFGGGALSETITASVHPSYTPYTSTAGVSGFPSAMQLLSLSTGNTFPERPGQPECQYYMKTGDCKFGMACHFHHPKERLASLPNCALSPIGLPLRPGVTECAFYMRYGICKFGPTCKFDHPMNSLACSPSTSSLTDMPLSPYLMGFSVAAFVPRSPEAHIRGHRAIVTKDPPADARTEHSDSECDEISQEQDQDEQNPDLPSSTSSNKTDEIATDL